MHARRLTPCLGARLSADGLLAGDGLRAAVVHHGVVFTRTAGLTPADLLGLARTLGEVAADPHPASQALDPGQPVTEILTDRSRPPRLNHWHSDASFTATPPRFTVLYCVETPPVGGDTLWACSASACAMLGESMLQRLLPLRARHRLPATARALIADPALREAPFQASHPLVILTPDAGVPCLYVNRLYTAAIEALPTLASRRLLQRLFRGIEHPEHQLRWRWRAGDVAVWDNQRCQHYAVADYYPQRRRMLRITVAGMAPVAA